MSLLHVEVKWFITDSVTSQNVELTFKQEKEGGKKEKKSKTEKEQTSEEA